MSNKSLASFIVPLFMLSALGCQNPYGPFAPAPTQIPPPPTGTASRANDYYSNRQTKGNVPYTARAKGPRARFSSESPRNRTRQEPRLDTSLDTPPSALDSAANRADSARFNNDLEWRSPAQQQPDVMTATFEDARPRPRFAR